MEEIADFTGLGPFLAMPVKTYSAGMQARLAFAAATAVEADVLLMDEWIAVGRRRIPEARPQATAQAGGDAPASWCWPLKRSPLLKLYCNKVMRLDGGRGLGIVDIRQLDEPARSLGFPPLRRLHLLELAEQQEVVADLQASARSAAARGRPRR
jgi:lipopolysaccharide transport system ATP-binding protein